MTLVVFRTFLGFLAQVAPCAILCFLPFTRSLTEPLRRVIKICVAAFALAEIPFCLVVVLTYGGDDVSLRFLIQDVVFITLVAALIGLYFTRVDAPLPQKTFAALIALNLGFFGTIMNENVGVLLGLPGKVEYRYPTELLISLSAINAVLLVPMVPLMRRLGRMFQTLPDSRIWTRMCILPGCFFGIMYVFHQLPLEVLPIWTLYCVQTTAIMAFAVFMFWWILGVARTVNDTTLKRERLTAALKDIERSRDALDHELQGTKERVTELDRALAMRDGSAGSLEREGAAEGLGPDGAGLSSGAARANSPALDGGLGNNAGSILGDDASAWENEVITLTGSKQAVSFLAGDLRYVESNNRMRVLHLADGGDISIDAPLMQIYQLLPPGHFAYCHRSVVVNLHRVVEAGAGALVLDDGTRHPMSRRRYMEFRAALAAADEA